MYPAHAKVTKFIFIADPDDFGFIPDPGFAQYMIDVVNIFKGGTLASTHTVSGTDHKSFVFTLAHCINVSLKFFVCFCCMTKSTNRNSMAVFRSQTFSCTKI